MHAILSQYIEDLSHEFDIQTKEESKLFEYFCNYVITSKYFLGRFNPIDITTQEDDASLDGISIIIDGELIISVDDATAAFETYKTSLPVDIIITQVKSGESFLKDDISNFNLGLQDFLSLEPKLPNGIYNGQAIEIIKIIVANVKKIKNKMPNLKVFFCTSGVYNKEREIVASFKVLERTCENADIFNDIEVFPMGRKELMKLWSSISDKNEASLQLIDYIGINEMPGIPQAYISIVKAKEFLEKIAMDDEGNIREEVFDENVRAFLGGDNPVNKDIAKTLHSEKSKQFAVLNNGVTIIAPEIAIQSNTKVMHLTNYQIINGCQTTNTLYEHYADLNDSVELVVKFIESQNTDVAIEIVTATNNQSAVENESFYALREKARLIQKFFDIQRNDEVKEKLFFERRENEYRNKSIQTTKIYDIKELTRCFISVFKMRPHDASRYVKKVLNTSDIVFDDRDNECAYHCAAYICYKFNTLINGRKNEAQKYNRLRWHVAMLYPWVVNGKIDTPDSSSKKISKYCDNILKTLLNEEYIEHFKTCQKIIDSIEMPTDDQIKRGKYTTELKDAAEEFLKKLND
ncbi:AIPR family protein [Raoultella ornithinolytica]|uniref:AIPR family protein n=1 Tax=Klebsiella/Raoultella group TaxID=2890311 RepID=UPI000DE743E6|nr:AIPR family protein [Klebsiella pneumoniae]EKQ8001231.1 AIPR family protein [Raoultella ornithinolytica]HDS7134771.1 AIPR family protein [Klebsiella aerogenes]EKU0199883.1 AIPR family protein [Raoultella ornithinolytica]EKV0508701.1 AIPR family protein [Raoultella ornithinolytica]EKW3194855.1 AIPR family protein [Raoultella ornithinolytica]